MQYFWSSQCTLKNRVNHLNYYNKCSRLSKVKFIRELISKGPVVGDVLMTAGFYVNYLIFYVYCDAMVKNAYRQYKTKDMRNLCMTAVEAELNDAYNSP